MPQPLAADQVDTSPTSRTLHIFSTDHQPNACGVSFGRDRFRSAAAGRSTRTVSARTGDRPPRQTPRGHDGPGARRSAIRRNTRPGSTEARILPLHRGLRGRTARAQPATARGGIVLPASNVWPRWGAPGPPCSQRAQSPGLSRRRDRLPSGLALNVTAGSLDGAGGKAVEPRAVPAIAASQAMPRGDQVGSQARAGLGLRPTRASKSRRCQCETRFDSDRLAAWSGRACPGLSPVKDGAKPVARLAGGAAARARLARGNRGA